MKSELLKKMKYEMPGAAKGPKGKGPAMPEETEIEISMGPEDSEEEGMPEMLAEVEDEGEATMAEEGPDLSIFSDEELQAELDRRMAKSAPPSKPSPKMA